MVKGQLISNDADWSDEDGVKSGSATGVSEAENDDLNKGKQKAIIMAKSLNGRKFDPVNIILDKIDAELSSLGKSQSSSTTGSTVLRKPGSRSKGSDGSRSGGSHKSLSSKDGTDTGLGTASIHDNLSEGGDLPRINGTAEIYSDIGAVTTDHYSDEDAKKTGPPSDLDSVTAQQVDAKFKAILRKKKGGYLDNLKASDTETIRTEDFENTFKEALVYQSDSDTLENMSDEDSDNVSGKLTDSGAETPTKADLSWDYYDTDQSKANRNTDGEERVFERPLSPSGLSQNRTPSQPLPYPSDPPRNGTLSQSKTVRQTENRLSSQPRGTERQSTFHGSKSSPRRQASYSRRKLGNISDADSIKTEDFEVKFQELVFRPSAESETDHTENDPLHAKVKEILKVTAPYRQKKEKKPNGRVKIDEQLSQKTSLKRNSKGKWHFKQNYQSFYSCAHPYSSLDSTSSGDKISKVLVRKQHHSDKESLLSSSLDLSVDTDSKDTSHDEGKSLTLNPAHLESYANQRRLTSLINNISQSSNRRCHLKHEDTSLDSIEQSAKHKVYHEDSYQTSSIDSFPLFDHQARTTPDESLRSAKHQVLSSNRSLSTRNSLSSISTGYLGSMEDAETSSNAQSSIHSNSDFLGCYEPYPNLPSPLLDQLFQSVSVLQTPSDQSVGQVLMDSGSGTFENSLSKGMESSGDNLPERCKTRRDVFLPEDEEEFPFSRYTFNKKPEKEVLSTSSEKSTSSCDSVTSDCPSLPGGQNLRQSGQSCNSLFYRTSANADHVKPGPHHPTGLYHTSIPSHFLQRDSLCGGLGYGRESFMSHGENPTDQLYNLGFGGVENFLPDRFARDWYQKLQKAYQERMDQQRLQLLYQQMCPDQNTQPQSGCNSGMAELIKNKDGRLFHQGPGTKPAQSDPLKRTQTTLQKLHQLLTPDSSSVTPKGRDVAYSRNDSNSVLQMWDGEARMGRKDNDLIGERRRKQFYANRQYSLPSYLETLEEKDEKLMQMQYRKFNPQSTVDQGDSYSSGEVGCEDTSKDVEQDKRVEINNSILHQDSSKLSSEGQGHQVLESKVLGNLDQKNTKINTAENTNVEYPAYQGQSSNGNNGRQVQGCDQNSSKGQGNFDKAHVPSIHIRPTTIDSRNDSLEVAEILVKISQANTPVGKVRKSSKISNLLHVNDDRMLTLSPHSGSSSSPAVFSPVTVIEFNLDNQSDNMDTEESNNTFRQNGFSSTNPHELDPGGHAFLNDNPDTNRSVRRNSFIDTLAFKDCREHINNNDIKRRLSLDFIYKNSNTDENSPAVNVTKQTTKELVNTSTPKSDVYGCHTNGVHKQEKYENSCGDDNSNSNDVCIQADDGRLSPLLRWSDVEKLLQCLEVFDGTEHSYYLAQDRGTQWISSDLPDSSDSLFGDLNDVINKEKNCRLIDTGHKGTATMTTKFTDVQRPNLDTKYGVPSNTGHLGTKSTVWNHNISMKMHQTFDKDDADPMEENQGKKANQRLDFGCASPDRKTEGNLGTGKGAALDGSSSSSSQVTIVTVKDSSVFPNTSNFELEDNCDSGFPVFSKRESVDSQTMRKFFSSQKLDSIRQTSLDTFSQTTLTDVTNAVGNVFDHCNSSDTSEAGHHNRRH